MVMRIQEGNNRKFVRNFMFRSAGCFSSSLDDLHGDLGINKLQCRNSCTGLKWSREVIKQVFKISVVDTDPQWECGTGSRRAQCCGSGFALILVGVVSGSAMGMRIQIKNDQKFKKLHVLTRSYSYSAGTPAVA
jgi:hypothetical protein